MSKLKKKNNYNFLKMVLSISLLIPISFFLLMLLLSQQPVKQEVSSNNSNSEETVEGNSDSTIESNEPSTNIISKELSYVEQVELDFVEQPLKRTREEAVAKIKELSRWYPALYFVYENEAQYPLELLLSGAGNPEMTDYLYGYLSSDGSITGGFTDQEQPQDYPLFLQFDPRWGYLPYGTRGTIGSSGCGPACLSMAVFYLTGNRDCTPGAIAQYSLDNKYYVEGIGTSWSLLTDYPAEYGLTSYQVQLSESNLKAELDKGRYLICSVREGDFTSAGHFILIYGYDENGFKINDPKCVYRSRLTWTYKQIRDDIKATWSIGK